MSPKLTPILQRGCKGEGNAYLPRQGLNRPTEVGTADVLMHSISLGWGLVGVSLTCRGESDVLETAFTVQKAPCTFRGKGHPLQKTSPVRWARPKYGPNSFKFQWSEMCPKVGLDPHLNNLNGLIPPPDRR